MALFHINRYLGEEGEEEEAAPDSESRARLLLVRLQQKAKAKERLSLTSQAAPTPAAQKRRAGADGDVEPKLPKKRKKGGVTPAAVEVDDAVEDQEVAAEEKKKKRKKGGVTPAAVEVDDAVEDQEVAAEEEEKKKKKKDAKKKQKKNDQPGVTPTLPQTDSVAVGPEEEEEEEEEEIKIKTVTKKKKKKDTKQKLKPKDQSADSLPGAGEDVAAEGSKAETQEVESKRDVEKPPVQTSFMTLGGFEKKPVPKVYRVLPQWLSQPDVVHRDIRSNLVPVSEHHQGLSAQLVKKLEKNGIQQLFPVQAEVIPAILEGVRHGLLIGRGGYRPRDICVSAPTGSGKTIAFVVPVVQALMQRVVCEVRALAVLPTKELAQQVCKVFTSYAEGTTLRVVMLAGQKSFAAEQAALSEDRGGMRRSLADIVVATPGRLVDHINRTSGFRLEHLRFLIIDEADRMIDSMHQSWLSQVTKAVYCSGSDDVSVPSIFKRTEPTHITAASLAPPQPPLQKLLFSATLTQDPEKLQQLGLHRPRLFSSVHACSAPGSGGQTQGLFNFPQGLTEFYVPSTQSNKPLHILHFVLRMKFSPILCFTNSRQAAHRLYLLVHLYGGVQTAEFSSRLSPSERKKTLKDFERGKIQLLISTDAAARGIDINGVKCVVNYDAPQYIRTYIHRVGRTARAGKSGLAFTFLLGIQEKKFLQMVKDAGSPGVQKQLVKSGNLKTMEVRYEQTLHELANTIKDEKAM